MEDEIVHSMEEPAADVVQQYYPTPEDQETVITKPVRDLVKLFERKMWLMCFGLPERSGIVRLKGAIIESDRFAASAAMYESVFGHCVSWRRPVEIYLNPVELLVHQLREAPREEDHRLTEFGTECFRTKVETTACVLQLNYSPESLNEFCSIMSQFCSVRIEKEEECEEEEEERALNISG